MRFPQLLAFYDMIKNDRNKTYAYGFNRFQRTKTLYKILNYCKIHVIWCITFPL